MTSDGYKEWRLLANTSDHGVLLDRLLLARGFQTPEEAAIFLRPTLEQLHDPYLLPDMQLAAELLLQAIDRKSSIAIHGDYDVDGLTGTALLVLFLRAHGIEPVVLIPDRFADGYGLTEATASQLIDAGIDLLITVDCGISSIEEIAHLKNSGIQVIVTDHHECAEQLPPADAVINPKRPDSRYPFPSLAGAAVALKLVQACCRSQPDEQWLRYLDLVCIGTVADVVPLTDENRVLVACGLAQLNQTVCESDQYSGIPPCSSVGLSSLIQTVNPDQKQVTARLLGFSVSPKLNAAGRMGDTDDAIRLLLTDDPQEADKLARRLVEINNERRLIENEMTSEAIALLDQETNLDNQAVLIACKPDWHPGVIGIAAARLAEYYMRPVIVLTREGDQYRGSCRSWGEINLLDILKHAAPFIDRFGGHREAAGLTLSVDRLTDFRRAVQEYARQLGQKTRQADITADLVVSASDLTIENAETLRLLEPFGQGNQLPLFIFQGLMVTDLRVVGQGDHLKMTVQYGGTGQSWDAIAFRQAGAGDWLAPGDLVDLLFSLDINEWRGRRSIQLNVRDIHPSDKTGVNPSVLFEAEQLYQSHQDIHKLAAQINLSFDDLLPDRADYRMVYQYLRTHFNDQPKRVDLWVLAMKIAHSYQKQIHLFQLSRILNVFEEAGLVDQQRIDFNQIKLRLIPVRGKVSLEHSPTFRQMSRVLEGGVT